MRGSLRRNALIIVGSEGRRRLKRASSLSFYSISDAVKSKWKRWPVLSGHLFHFTAFGLFTSSVQPFSHDDAGQRGFWVEP